MDLLRQVSELNGMVPGEHVVGVDAAPDQAVARLVRAKQEFLQLKAQETLLATVASSGSSVSREWCFHADSVTGAHAAVQRARDESASQASDRHGHVSMIERHSDAIGAGISELQGLADEYRKLSSDARGLQVDHDTDPETQASAALDAAQAQLEHQISTMQVLTQRIADLEASQQALQAETSSATVRSSNLRPLAQGLVSQVSNVAQSHETHERRLVTMQHWYSRASKCLRSVAGVQLASRHVVNPSDAETSLQLQVLLRPTHKLHALTCTEGHACLGSNALPRPYALDLVVQPADGRSGQFRARIMSAKLTCASAGGRAAPFINDIVAAAQRDADGVSIAWLVSEIHSRIHCEAARLAHLTLLRARFASTSSGSSDVVRARPTEVTFTLPCQVVVSARISADYPKPTSSVTITELACVGWPKPARESMDLPALQARVNNAHQPSLLRLAAEIQEQCQEALAMASSTSGAASIGNTVSPASSRSGGSSVTLQRFLAAAAAARAPNN